MHRVFNEMKRAYWRSHAMLAPIAKRHGLTPSRFDLMVLIAQEPTREILHSELRSKIGSTRGVVYRMVQALEELGLVERDIYVMEKGSFFVCLTDEGSARVDAMLEDLARAELAMESVVSRNWLSEESRRADAKELVTRLERVRRARGDDGNIDYHLPLQPWRGGGAAAHDRRAYAARVKAHELILRERRAERRRMMQKRRRRRLAIAGDEPRVVAWREGPDLS
jgi:DNA-binding MarR family transcriptional regulator